MIVRVLTTCHTQYTWDRSICIFLFNRTTLQVFVTYLTSALYVHPLWFYKHQYDNRIHSKLFVACQRWRFQWRFAAILVNCAPSGEMHNYCTPHIIKRNYENFLIHQCNYILLSQVYCVWQVVKTPIIIFNNPVFFFNSCSFQELIAWFLGCPGHSLASIPTELSHISSQWIQKIPDSCIHICGWREWGIPARTMERNFSVRGNRTSTLSHVKSQISLLWLNFKFSTHF